MPVNSSRVCNLLAFLTLNIRRKGRWEVWREEGGGRKLLDLIDNFSNISAFKIDI